MGDTFDLLDRLKGGSVVFTGLALAAFAVSMTLDMPALRGVLLGVASALTAMTLALWSGDFVARRVKQRRLALVMAFLEHDEIPGFCTDDEGGIFVQNRAALSRVGGRKGQSMTQALNGLFANPEAVVQRLLRGLEGHGSTHEDVVTRHGQTRVTLHRIPGGCLWRLEDLTVRPSPGGEHLALPMLSSDASGSVTFMNQALRDLVGVRARRLAELFREQPLRNGEVATLVTNAGQQAVRLGVAAGADGQQDVVVIPAEDNRDRRVAMDSLPVALLRLDPEGQVTFANERARALLPNLDDGSGQRFSAMVEGLGRPVDDWVQEAALGRIMDHPEIVRVTGAQSESFLQVTLGRPIGGGHGGLIAVLNDATELKTMEAQFVQSQKMQAIGQLAGGVAHDFNNLLTAISGHCDLLLLRHGEGDEDNADLLQITQNANRAAALVGQLLAFSRKQTLQMQRIDLRDTLGDLTHLLNRLVGERVSLQTDHDPALLPIRGDRRQLEQVLMNLVVNARDAMPDGGTIRIETRCRYLERPLRRDRVSVPAGQFVVVSVIDDGCGIPADRLSRIFEPFYTTKRPGEGTGLGLSMAYGIVKQSGGYIFADSVPNEGTTFSVYLPADSSTGTAEAPVVPGPVAPLPEPRPEPLAVPAPLAAEPEPPEAAPEPEDRSPVVAEVPEAPPAPVDTIEFTERTSPDDAPMRDMGGAEQDLLASISAPLTEEPDPAIQLQRAPVAANGPEARPSPRAAAPQSRPDRLAAAPVAPPAPDALPTTSATPRRRVLLVEDEAPVRAFATRALKLRGFEVLEAVSAEEALEKLEDKDMIVDLFVTDVIMPGLDGPTWVRKAMVTRPNVRTVFMSGYAQDALSEHAPSVPNAQFLPKPFSLADFTRTVEHALK